MSMYIVMIKEKKNVNKIQQTFLRKSSWKFQTVKEYKWTVQQEGLKG